MALKKQGLWNQLRDADLLAVLLVGGFTELWELTRRTEVAALFGTWLIGKGWRDLFPSKRNTASWSFLPQQAPRD